MRTAIVVPCYNEADRLDIEAFEAYARPRSWLRFVMVDDGSADDTVGVLTALADRLGEQARVVPLARNQGKAEAVRTGIIEALDAGWADAVGFWDADLATPLLMIENFARVLEERREVEMVIGSRVKLLGRRIDRDTRRHYFGRVAAFLVSNMLNLSVYDTQCGAKLFRASDKTRGLFAEPFSTRWAFDVEVLARWIGGSEGTRADLEQRVVEYPLPQWTDVAGSKLQPTDFLRTPIDLATIYRRYRGVLRD
jgi:dolichyl-phosphate beta-glucosyltransferase